MPIPNTAPCPLVQLRARARRCWAGTEHGHGMWWGSRGVLAAAGWAQPPRGLSSPLRSLRCGQRLRRVLARLRIYRTRCAGLFLLQGFGPPDKGLLWCFQKGFAPCSSTPGIRSSAAAALHLGATVLPSPACPQPAGAVPVHEGQLQGEGPWGELPDWLQAGLKAAMGKCSLPCCPPAGAETRMLLPEPCRSRAQSPATSDVLVSPMRKRFCSWHLAGES